MGVNPKIVDCLARLDGQGSGTSEEQSDRRGVVSNQWDALARFSP
jgi:hypothetical protein